MRKIAVLSSFFEAHHTQQVLDTAARCGFTVDLYNDDTIPQEKRGEYEVLYGFPTPSLLPTMTGMRWFCSASAGIDMYADDALYADPEHVLVSNSAGAFGITIAEHIMMVTLMLLRQMPAFQQVVRERRWVRSMPMRSICGSTVTILGTGDIGTNFARRAKAMGAAAVYGVRRTKKAADPCYDGVYTHEELDSLLPKTDILLLALPATPETDKFLSRERIALLKESSIVVNVGRGNAIDQDALMEALNAERIAGAALDVMDPEPLPADHPLWDIPNVIITPHVAGNMLLEITRRTCIEMAQDNLKKYLRGEKLDRVVIKGK